MEPREVASRRVKWWQRLLDKASHASSLQNYHDGLRAHPGTSDIPEDERAEMGEGGQLAHCAGAGDLMPGGWGLELGGLLDAFRGIKPLIPRQLPCVPWACKSVYPSSLSPTRRSTRCFSCNYVTHPAPSLELLFLPDAGWVRGPGRRMHLDRQFQSQTQRHG